jgi:hypothetical protein
MRAGGRIRKGARVSDGTNAPFRELFVEVPDVLLEILRSTVEQQLPPAPYVYRTPSIAYRVVEWLSPDRGANRALLELFGLEQLVVERSPRERVVEFIGVRPCRYREHEAHASITEEALEDVERSLVSELIRRALVRATQHPCYCVAPPRTQRREDGGHVR